MPENKFQSLPDKFKVTLSLFLFLMSCEEIFKTYNSWSNSKATGFDSMNPIIIKSYTPFLAAPFTSISNLSFSLGIYPSLLKKAIVISVFKSGQNTDPSNYRPISVFTFFANYLKTCSIIEFSNLYINMVF